MGKRREPRKAVELRVHIFGTDGGGKIFSENLTALDVSQNGARLTKVHAHARDGFAPDSQKLFCRADRTQFADHDRKVQIRAYPA